MTICIIYPECSKESALELAEKMGWEAVNPFKAKQRDFRKYDGVFNYGCNREIYARNVLNKTKSVATCINKVATFKVFEKAGIPTVKHTTNRFDTVDWDCVVIRDKVDGARAEGLDYHYNDERKVLTPGPIPAGALYTEGFEHEYELRVVIFCGKLVGCYKKVNKGGRIWEFEDFDEFQVLGLTDAAWKAAKALDIDYVGFDVLVNDKGVYAFLEANSGCILTDDVVDAIKAYF